MKKLLLHLLFALYIPASADAQTVPVADGPFLDSLRAKYPSCFVQVGSGWELDTNCPEVVTEDSLIVIGDGTGLVYDITPLPYFVNLKFLHLEYIGVSWMGLSSTPGSLEKFIYRNIDGTIQDTMRFNRGLRYLDASFNPTIGGINHWPDSLRHLFCQESGLGRLPALPAFLETLNCASQRGVGSAGNILTSLPALPSTLISLTCSHNALSSLPLLPDGLKVLDCMVQERNVNSQDRELTLSALPDLPSSLERLNAGGNKITTLPSLPASLKHLRITQTRFFEDDLVVGGSTNVVHEGISVLPSLPPSLEILECGWNNLTSLPPLPASLTYLDASENVRVHGQGSQTPGIVTAGITSLGSPLHDGMEYLNVSLTPITCLPRIPATMQVVVTTGSAISCLPNSSNYNAVPPLPLCSPTNNVNQCESSPVISGELFYDINSNGIQDANENPRANVEVQLASGLSAYSNTN
ncbi:MAG: hypothetical protein EOO04_22800 [Chitinophagaceae bacterium]|nr:MAG: hypothetical protein EOO04_22800 [Chitinophagaceae bacterium]